MQAFICGFEKLYIPCDRLTFSTTLDCLRDHLTAKIQSLIQRFNKLSDDRIIMIRTRVLPFIVAPFNRAKNLFSDSLRSVAYLTNQLLSKRYDSVALQKRQNFIYKYCACFLNRYNRNNRFDLKSRIAEHSLVVHHYTLRNKLARQEKNASWDDKIPMPKIRQKAQSTHLKGTTKFPHLRTSTCGLSIHAALNASHNVFFLECKSDLPYFINSYLMSMSTVSTLIC